MHNWHLFDQLEVLYQEHQAVLEASYLGPLRRNDRLKAQLASLDDIHPLRLGKAWQLLKEIEAKLRAEDYATNAEATPLLDELETHLQKAQNEFQNWEQQLATWRMRLKELMIQVWAEDYQALKADYQQQKQLIQQNQFPRQPLALQEVQVNAALEKRTADWQSLQKALRFHPRLRKRSQQWHNHYLPREQFVQESKKLKRKARFRAFATVLLGLVLLGSGASAAYFIPRWQQSELDTTAWQNAKIQASVGGYDTYLQVFPKGQYRDSAEMLRLRITEGTLQGLSNEAGQTF
ncbi:MAG: hypothetical protein AAFP02_26025, partial [Bacteroidota bacterium]